MVLWWRGPNWSLLYGNLSDSDASSVVQALQTAGIEYKLDDASGAIMVPAERVRDARLQLASQGLPQGKNGGFALISKDPGFGVSQFMENARYQYALETELAQTISRCRRSRPRACIWRCRSSRRSCSDQRPASASVLLQLRAGHRLEPEQVSAIVHLVASSIPELDSDQVTVVDQEGRLLSSPKSGDAAIGGRAVRGRAPHRGHLHRAHRAAAGAAGRRRPRARTGDGGSRRDASEQAQEQYKPDSAVVRSEQTSEQHRAMAAAPAASRAP